MKEYVYETWTVYRIKARVETERHGEVDVTFWWDRDPDEDKFGYAFRLEEAEQVKAALLRIDPDIPYQIVPETLYDVEQPSDPSCGIWFDGYSNNFIFDPEETGLPRPLYGFYQHDGYELLKIGHETIEKETLS